ncbi:MAG: hypothetical protein F4Y08_14780 [Caldilineaceae bacterium SB0662_bin_9]|uniref:Redoxin domain-containing protein n=1 Tax=Caldilineaceae bacterium SB0662_bin_9 TaxID=2605258 RepID=A0A6B1DUS1_9CHLR|nr:hypothetical protein [Caldilineaceae bacterium SB0662_bin_9]
MTGSKALLAVAACLVVAVVASGCIWTHEQMRVYWDEVEEGLAESEEEAPMTAIRFPEVAGRDIDGNDFVVPTDFAGNLNLVLMAFTREHQYDVNTWLPHARELESSRQGFRVYEVPTLWEMNWFQRRQLDFWMSTGIQDPLARATTITLYTDLQAMQAALAIPDFDTIQVLLIDRDGLVVWRSEGTFSKAKFEDLTATLIHAHLTESV